MLRLLLVNQIGGLLIGFKIFNSTPRLHKMLDVIQKTSIFEQFGRWGNYDSNSCGFSCWVSYGNGSLPYSLLRNLNAEQILFWLERVGITLYKTLGVVYVLFYLMSIYFILFDGYLMSIISRKNSISVNLLNATERPYVSGQVITLWIIES